MNLSREQQLRLNHLLSNKELDIPKIRRHVSPTGSNYHWLQKHILQRNSEIVSLELKGLLYLK